jgi:hypothetical protein
LEFAMLDFRKGFAIFAGALISATVSTHAETYMFRVSCADETYIALWDGGSSDPGKGRFRIATGDANQNCLIYNYNAKTDGSLPRRWCSDPGAAIEMFPPILILSGATHCR